MVCEKLYRNTLTIRQAAAIEIFKRLVIRLIRVIYFLRSMINLSSFASLFIHVFIFFSTILLIGSHKLSWSRSVYNLHRSQRGTFPMCIVRLTILSCMLRLVQAVCVICRVIFALGKSRFQRYMWWHFRSIPSLCRSFPHYTTLESCWNTLFW